jgi:ATP-binding cassette subfamily B protein
MADLSAFLIRRRVHSPLRALVPYLKNPISGHDRLALLALLTASPQCWRCRALRYLIDEGDEHREQPKRSTGTSSRLPRCRRLRRVRGAAFLSVTWLGERVIADLRSDVYSRVIRMDPTFFEVTRTGEVLSRLTADTTLVQSIAGVNLSITLRSIITILGSLVMLAITSLKLTGLILVLIPLILGPLLTLGRRVRRLSRASQDRIADTSGLAGESLNAIQTVQAFTLEDIHARRFGQAVEDSFRAPSAARG